MGFGIRFDENNSADAYGRNKVYDPLKRDLPTTRSQGTSLLDEPGIGEVIDEPVPEVYMGCCCPCPIKTNPIPFVVFGPIQ